MTVSPLLLFKFFGFICYCSSLQWLGEENIGSYGEYRNVKLLRYDIPVNTREVIWEFRPRRAPPSCENIPIHVILQYGGIPPVNALNETYPEHFYLERSNQYHFTIDGDNASSYSILRPRSGSWYSAMFRPYQHGKITQKGLSSGCSYYVELSYDTPTDVFYHTIPSSGLTTNLHVNNQSQYIQFNLEESVYEYTVSVFNCQPSCDVQLTFLGTQLNSSLPDTVNCTSTSCQFTVTSPGVDLPQKYQLTALEDSLVNISLKVETKDCVQNEENVTATNCVLFKDLDRLQFQGDFNVAFAYIVNDTLHPIKINVTSNIQNNLPFHVVPQLDLGGTLVIELVLVKSSVNTSVQHTRVCGTVLQDYLLNGLQDASTLPDQPDTLCSNSSGESAGILYIPYPEPGTWFISLQADCFTGNGSSVTYEPCVDETRETKLKVSTSKCYQGGCSFHGTCKEYAVSPSLAFFTTCVCAAGWRGYGCSDGTDAFSVGRQLQEVLLLTLSNLFFLPGIVIAIKRKYYVNALVYTYNMFFSTFYHACDGDREEKYTLCIMHYNALSFCDFLGSVCSLWVTVIAMAKVHKPVMVLLQMSAPLFIVIGVIYDKTSLYVIAVPLLLALGILAVSWAVRCQRRRKCYPTWKRYVFILLPGILIAGTGAMLFAFAETVANYRYIHSVWHMTLSLSIIFLLPPRKDYKNKISIHSNGVRLLACDQSDNDSDRALITPSMNINNGSLHL